jgi:hypothetical protein
VVAGNEAAAEATACWGALWSRWWHGACGHCGGVTHWSCVLRQQGGVGGGSGCCGGSVLGRQVLGGLCGQGGGMS